jgi:hypothetical protein
MDAKTVLKGITRPVAPVALAAKLLDPGINAILPENDNQQPLSVTARRPEEYADDTAHGPHVPKAVEVRAVDVRQMTSGSIHVPPSPAVVAREDDSMFRVMSGIQGHAYWR